jgi:hypothetical protein
MVLGLLLIAMFGASGVSIALFVYDFPLWVVLLAYPAVGSAILLPGVALVGWIRNCPPDDESSPAPTSQSPAAPHQRSPAGSSNR